MYKACIFDLDGTLLNTLDTVTYYGNKTLQSLGFGSVDSDQFRDLCRLSIHDFYRKMLKYAGCTPEEIEQNHLAAADLDLKFYESDPYYLTKPYEGIPAALAELRHRGVRLAVLTNKPDPLAQAVIRRFFGDTFDLCVGQSQVSISKPDPRSLWNLMNSMTLDREDCIYVGDTDVDLITANRAEVFSLAAAWGYQPLESLTPLGPGGILQSPEELLSYF